MRMTLLFLCPLWAFFCGTALADVAASASPDTAAPALRRAVDNADAALLDSVADVRSIVGEAVDMFLQDARTPEGKAALPPLPALILSSTGDNPRRRAALRDFLRREAEELVRYGVRSGAFAGKPRQAPPPEGILAPLFADVSLGRKEIRQIGRAVREGDAAYVPFTVHDHGNGNDYPVQALLRRAGKEWRIVSIRNLREIMDQIRRESLEAH